MGNATCTDAAFREFREALERGPEPLPSAALLPDAQDAGSLFDSNTTTRSLRN